MSYLTHLSLDIHHHAARTALADAHRMHALTMSGFPPYTGEHTRQHFGVLFTWRTKPGHLDLVIRSRVTPDWSSLADATQTLTVAPTTPPAQGSTVRYRLVAAPMTAKAIPGIPRGRRTPITSETDSHTWLADRAPKLGFHIEQGSATRQPPIRSAIRNDAATADSTCLYRPMLFTGVLTVTDPTAFTQTLDEGIGRGRAYGCGLLLTRP